MNNNDKEVQEKREEFHEDEAEPKTMLELIEYKKSTERFLKCITKMVVDCAPADYLQGGHADLKLVWKFIKKMMTEFVSVKKETEYLKRDEEILQSCCDVLFIEEKNEVPAKITEILMKKNRLFKIISKLKLHFNLSSLQTLEDLEKYLFSELVSSEDKS